MIVPSYGAFRGIFAAAGAVAAEDGQLTFPGTEKLRTGGFTGMATPTITACCCPVFQTCYVPLLLRT